MRAVRRATVETRDDRPAAKAALLGVLTLFLVPWALALATSPAGVTGLVGYDFGIYRDATIRWLGGGDFYLARQLAGPYAIANGDVLYPPTALYLFLPFVWLPAVVWYAVPLGVTGWLLARWRPSVWAWAGIVACLLIPHTFIEFLKGNPVMWVIAFEALALEGFPTGPLVALKASLFPFALIGVRRREWWLVAAAAVLATLPLLPLVGEWLRAVSGANGGLLYSAGDVPLLLIPLIGWWGRQIHHTTLTRSPATGGG